MSSKSPWLRRLLVGSLGLAGGLAGTVYLTRRLLQRSLPQISGSRTLSGLRRPVEIIRDRWGVPHIYAKTEEDLFFAQGYVQAQDRLFQMDANRRVGSGRLSEIVGPLGVETDRFARICGWHRAAQAQVAGIMKDEETRAVSEAFAAGVNAFMQEERLPLEFSLLAYRPEPWTPFDGSAWGAVLAWGLSVNWQTELLRARLVETLGPQKAADLTPSYDGYAPTILPATEVGAGLSEALLEAFRRVVSEVPLGSVPSGAGLGSNNWVLGGDWTTTGRPMLANDPHLPPVFPTLWYENHLVGGRYNVTGFTTPGVPGVIIGHNEHVAWGITNAFPDVQDLYVERFHPHDPLLYDADGHWQTAEERREVIHVRGQRSPVEENVRYTRHGPIISGLVPGEERQLALRWACHDENNHVRAMLGVCRATGWDSFRDALRDWAFPPQNIVYADISGNVGYAMPGRVPLRAKGEGLVPVPGWTGEYEWRGWIAPEALPSLFNPSPGYIVTANNRVAGDDYPYFLGGEWQPPYRARRIAQLIETLAPLDVADNARIQTDTVSLLALRFVALALPHLQGHALLAQSDVAGRAASLLQEWDGDMRPDRAAPAVAYGWLVCFVHAAMEMAVGKDLAQELLSPGELEEFPTVPFHEIAYELAVRWLDAGAPDWIGDVAGLLPAAIEEALSLLQKTLGPDAGDWRWGDLHYVEIHNHLTRIPGLGRLWRPRSFPIGGDGFSVNQAEVPPRFPPGPVHVIASCRMIVDVGAWDNSLSTLPGGQSGHPASDHYQDSVEEWLQGRYHPMLFSRDRVEAEAEGRLILQPGGK